MPLTQQDVGRIVKRVDHGVDTAQVAESFGVCQRRVQQLYKEYRDTGQVPVLGRRGRKAAPPPDGAAERVLVVQDRYRVGINAAARILRTKHGVRVGHRFVQDVLEEAGRVKEEPNRGGRKRPWVRYERSHSLSLVHMDWHYLPDGRFLCVVLDDASRKILAATEEPRISAKRSIELLHEAYRQNEWILPIPEVITDHGGEFYAMKRDKKGTSKHPFEQYCQEMGIRHVLCRVKHPQSNGKIERFFATYDKDRNQFPSLEEFVEWYNTIRPHMSLDWDNLETPEQAFWRKCDDIRLGNFLASLETEVQA